MKKNYLSRIISLVLSFSLLLSVCPNVYADESHTPSVGLNSFFKSGDDLKLTDHDPASHMVFVENMRNSTMGTLAMEVLTYIYDGNKSGEPDEAKYMEVLINIMKTYEMENATAISEQHKMDNLKSMEDYALEAMDIGIGLIPSFKNVDPKTQSIGDWIKIAMGGLSNLADNTNQWIEGLSNLETILQNYSKHDRFLALIAAKADGELRSAAANLRISLEKAVFVKLGTYADISNENFQNYTEFFFDDVFYEAVKLTDLYDSDSGFKFFVDLGANVNKLYTAAKLGAEIGKFIGNVAVNAEDIINRVLEMKAVYDISTILENELIEIKLQVLGSFSDETDKAAQDYAAYSNYLISGRIRGEHCMWSMLAKDSGLYSHFGEEKAMEAEQVYNALTTNLAAVKENLDAWMNVLVVDVSGEVSHETVTPNSEWYVYDVNGETYTDYTLRVYEKQTLTDLLMRYGSEDNDRSYTEYSVTDAEPLKLSLEAGYIYDFEFVDNANPDLIKKVNVHVTADDLGLASVVDVETCFGNIANDNAPDQTHESDVPSNDNAPDQTQESNIPSKDLIQTDLEKVLLAKNEYATMTDFQTVKSLTGEGSYEITLSVQAETKYADWTYEVYMYYRKYDQGWMVDRVRWISEDYMVYTLPDANVMVALANTFFESSEEYSLEKLVPVENGSVKPLTDELDIIDFTWVKVSDLKHGKETKTYNSHWSYMPNLDSWEPLEFDDSDEGDFSGYQIVEHIDVEFYNLDFSGKWDSVEIKNFSWDEFDMDWGEGWVHFNRLYGNPPGTISSEYTRWFHSESGSVYVPITLGEEYTHINVQKWSSWVSIVGFAQIRDELPVLGLNVSVEVTEPVGDGETPKETPASAFKYEYGYGEVKSPEGGYDSLYAVIITKYVGNDTVVVVPAEIDGLPVMTIAETAFAGSNIKELYFAGALTIIDTQAFAHCTELTTVVLPDNWMRLGNECFTGCTLLTQLEVPANCSFSAYEVWNDELGVYEYVTGSPVSENDSTVVVRREK